MFDTRSLLKHLYQTDGRMDYRHEKTTWYIFTFFQLCERA